MRMHVPNAMRGGATGLARLSRLGEYNPYAMQNALAALTNAETAAQRDDPPADAEQQLAQAQAAYTNAYSQLAADYSKISVPTGSVIAGEINGVLQTLAPTFAPVRVASYAPRVVLRDSTTGASMSGLGASGFNVGDSFTLTITGGAPNSAVTVQENGGGAVVMGTTDGAGAFSTSGVWGEGNVGAHSQVWYVGADKANAISFTVAAQPLPPVVVYHPQAVLVDSTTGARLSGLGATGFNVGDSFTLSITGGAPNSQVSVAENGGTSAIVGSTDAAGSYTASGVWQASDAGAYTQHWYVAGQPANTISFTVAPGVAATTTPGVSYSPSTDDQFVFQSIAAAAPFTPSEIAFAKVLEQYGSPVSSIFSSQEVQQLWQTYVAAGYDAGVVTPAVDQWLLSHPLLTNPIHRGPIQHTGSGAGSADSSAAGNGSSLYIAAGLGLAAWLFSR